MRVFVSSRLKGTIAIFGIKYSHFVGKILLHIAGRFTEFIIWVNFSRNVGFQ